MELVKCIDQADQHVVKRQIKEAKDFHVQEKKEAAKALKDKAKAASTKADIEPKAGG